MVKDIYGSGAINCKSEGQLPLYDQRVRIFRSTIAPSRGNNDNIVTPLANLLCLDKEIDENEESDSEFEVDVMDFIFHEYDSIVHGLTFLM